MDRQHFVEMGTRAGARKLTPEDATKRARTMSQPEALAKIDPVARRGLLTALLQYETEQANA